MPSRPAPHPSLPTDVASDDLDAQSPPDDDDIDYDSIKGY